MKLHTKYLLPMVIASAVFVNAKTAQEYFLKSANLYTDAAYPTAEIEAREGLTRYPTDTKLQMLLQRIQDAMKDQKDKNDKQNPGSSQGQSSSANKDQKNQGGSSGGQSSSSAANKDQKNQDKGNSSQAQNSSSAAQPKDSLQEGQLNKDQAEQLLKDFQENDKDRKRKAQMNGRAVPEKDW